MSRLIDADIIYQWYRDSFDFEPNEVKFSMLDIRDNLENIPTADVPNMTGDLISRQAAIDEIKSVYEWHDTVTMERLIEHLNNLQPIQPVATDTNVGDKISKFIDGLEEIFADLREKHIDDSVCGLCEYDGAYIGQSGDWCNECPGFERDDCFKLSDKTRKEWTDEIIKALPSAEPRKKGKWIKFNNSCTIRCNQCGKEMTSLCDIQLPNYCPNCGSYNGGEDE